MKNKIIGEHKHKLIEITTISDFEQGILKYICRYCNYKEKREMRIYFDSKKIDLIKKQ